MVTTRSSSGSVPKPAAAASANGTSASKAKGKGKAAPAAATEAVAKRTREEESSDEEAETSVKSPSSKQAKAKKAPAMSAAKQTARVAMAESSKQATDNEYSDSEQEDASDDDAILAGFSDVSGEDSSDEDDDDGEKRRGVITASGVVKLPSSKDDSVVRSRLEKVNKKRKERGNDSTPIVLYFGRVPKTMPEDALRAYLVQFGDIKRLRLARNKKTGATKHYAFVEFADEDVGKIVCETMNNYLLEGRLLQVHVVPKEKVHPSLWIGANRKYRAVPGDRRHRVLHDERPRTDEQKKDVERKLFARQKQRRDKIKAQGIDYDFEGYA